MLSIFRCDIAVAQGVLMCVSPVGTAYIECVFIGEQMEGEDDQGYWNFNNA